MSGVIYFYGRESFPNGESPGNRISTGGQLNVQKCKRNIKYSGFFKFMYVYAAAYLRSGRYATVKVFHLLPLNSITVKFMKKYLILTSYY